METWKATRGTVGSTAGTRRYEPLPMSPLVTKGAGEGGDGGGVAGVSKKVNKGDSITIRIQARNVNEPSGGV